MRHFPRGITALLVLVFIGPLLVLLISSAPAAATVCGSGGGVCYWIGGTGNFSSTAHWSSSSGGSSCTCVPAATDAVTFDASSGSGTATQDNAMFTSGAVTMTSSSASVNGSVNAWHVGGSFSDGGHKFLYYNSTIAFTATATLTPGLVSFGTSNFNNVVVNGGVTLTLATNGLRLAGYLELGNSASIISTNIAVALNTPSWLTNPVRFDGTYTINLGAGGFSLAPITPSATWTLTFPGITLSGSYGAFNVCNLGAGSIVTVVATGDIIATPAPSGVNGPLITINDVLSTCTGTAILDLSGGSHSIRGNPYLGYTGGSQVGVLKMGSGTVTAGNLYLYNSGSHVDGGSGHFSISGQVSIGSGTYITSSSSGSWAIPSSAYTWQDSSTSASWDFQAPITFASPSSPPALVFAGSNLPQGEFKDVYFTAPSSAITYTLGTRGLIVTGKIQISGGANGATLDTSASNFPITANGITVDSVSTLNARSSTITLNGTDNGGIAIPAGRCSCSSATFVYNHTTDNSENGIDLAGNAIGTFEVNGTAPMYIYSNFTTTSFTWSEPTSMYFDTSAMAVIWKLGNAALAGTSGNPLTLARCSPVICGTQLSDWKLNETHASPTASYVTVSYSDARPGSMIDATDGTNSGGGFNFNWDFPPPVITNGAATPTSVYHGTAHAYTFTFTATSPGGDPITWSKVVGPSWITISNSTGTMTVTPPNSIVTVNVTVRAWDGVHGTDYSWTLNVTDTAPTIVIGGGSSTDSMPTGNPGISATNLVLAYDMSSLSGSAMKDFSGTGNDGTITGTSIVAGKYGNARSFSGSDKISAADATSLKPTTFTVSVWVNPSSTPGSQKPLMGKVNYGGTSGWVAITSAANLNLEMAVFNTLGSSYNSPPTPSLPLSTWTHLAFTFDGSTIRTYENGVQVGAGTAFVGTFAPATTSFHVGSDGANTWPGAVDQVEFFSGALTAAQILDLATASSPANAYLSFYSILEGSTYRFTFTATDLEGDTVTWTLPLSLSWTHLGASNGTLWGKVPTDLSLGGPVTVQAYDGILSSTYGYTITITFAQPAAAAKVPVPVQVPGVSYLRGFTGVNGSNPGGAWLWSNTSVSNREFGTLPGGAFSFANLWTSSDFVTRTATNEFYDFSTLGHDGTIVGTTNSTGGPFGGALWLYNGAYVDFGDGPPRSAFTIVAWIRMPLTDPTNLRQIVGTDTYWLAVKGTTLWGGVVIGGSTFTAALTGLPILSYVGVGMSWDGYNLTIGYGSRTTTTQIFTIAEAVNAPSVNLTVGKGYGNRTTFTGDVDELAVLAISTSHADLYWTFQLPSLITLGPTIKGGADWSAILMWGAVAAIVIFVLWVFLDEFGMWRKLMGH